MKLLFIGLSLVLTTLINFDLINMESNRPNTKEVIACNLDLISDNKPSDDITSTIGKNTCLLWHVGLFSSLSLLKKRDIFREKAEEIALRTCGKGWITKKLAKYIKDEHNIELSDNAIKAMIDVGTEPVPNLDVISKIKNLVKNHVVVAFGNQDHLEYKIYQEKMQKQKINLDELFKATVIIKSYEDSTEKKGFTALKNKPWHLADEPYPSKSFTDVIEHAAQNLGHTGEQIPLIDTYDKLSQLTKS